MRKTSFPRGPHQRANADPRILLQQEVQNAELLARAGTPCRVKHAVGQIRSALLELTIGTVPIA